MAIWAISDLHLPGGGDKPMDVFGPHWAGHFDKIAQDWIHKVSPDDVVLLPGDLSWAMTLDAAKQDLNRVGELPGKKVILRGNHDYWWSSVSRVREALPPGMYAVQNDSLALNGWVICGTRLWTIPDETTSPEDVKIYNREILRLDMSLRDAARRGDGMPIICMTHYPPLTDQNADTQALRLMVDYGVKHAVYGHLHGAALKGAVRGNRQGVRLHQVSCDGLDFQLYLING